MWAYSIGLKDAYFHVPIHPGSRKYLRVAFAGQVYQFRALPFGISIAPWLFTKIMVEVKGILHRKGVPIHQYLDDWLGKAFTRELCASRMLQVVNLCQELGLLINKEKSELIPSQKFVFLGARYDLIQVLVFSDRRELGKKFRNR